MARTSSFSRPDAGGPVGSIMAGSLAHRIPEGVTSRGHTIANSGVCIASRGPYRRVGWGAGSGRSDGGHARATSELSLQDIAPTGARRSPPVDPGSQGWVCARGAGRGVDARRTSRTVRRLPGVGMPHGQPTVSGRSTMCGALAMEGRFRTTTAVFS